jgi:GT2 family glycosyltransferase
MEQHPNVGIAGTQLEFPDGEVQGTPFNFMNVGSELDRGLQSKVLYRLVRPWATTVNPKPNAARKVDWVAGASMIIRKAVFDRIGVLDDDYYTYYDDIDFCQSAAKAGFETWYVPEARIIHLEGKSTGIVNKTISPRADYWFQARRRYFLKHHGAAGAALADAAFIVGFAVRKARAKLTNQPLSEPPNMLEGAIKNSVFLTGFEMRAVENPALAGKSGSGKKG